MCWGARYHSGRRLKRQQKRSGRFEVLTRARGAQVPGPLLQGLVVAQHGAPSNPTLQSQVDLGGNELGGAHSGPHFHTTVAIEPRAMVCVFYL